MFTDSNAPITEENHARRMKHQKNQIEIGLGFCLLYLVLAPLLKSTFWIYVLPIMILAPTARHAILFARLRRWPDRYKTKVAAAVFGQLKAGTWVPVSRVARIDNWESALKPMVKEGIIQYENGKYRITPGKKNYLQRCIAKQ